MYQVSRDTLQTFVSRHPAKHFGRGEVILCQNEIPESIFVIKKGFVKGYDINSEGVEQLVWLGTVGDFFPTTWMASQSEGKSRFFYDAYTISELFCVEQQAFSDFLKSNSSASYEASLQLSASLHDSLQHVVALEKPKAQEKLIYTLRFLCQRFGRMQAGMFLKTTSSKMSEQLSKKPSIVQAKGLNDSHWCKVNSLKNQKSDNTKGSITEIMLPITHQDIANLVGLTRETVAVELKKLKDMGCIYYDRWHFVVYKDVIETLFG